MREKPGPKPMASDAPQLPGPRPAGEPAGNSLISVFARHATAPNLFMVILILMGVFALTRLNRQFFPTFEVPAIVVSVAWPGASAEDAETNILDVLEPELRFIDNISDVRSYAREGSATISLEFNPTANMQKAQSDVEQAVSRVTTLPEEAERPVITRAAMFDGIAKISISGPFSEAVLKAYAKKLRDGLLDAGIDKVSLTGARDEEIWIKVREDDLRRLGVSLDTVARIVRENSQDLPAGKLEGSSELQLRAKSDRKTPEEIAKIEVKSLVTGQKIILGDIADVGTRFARDGMIGISRGQRAIELSVQRSLSADTLKTMKIMEDYVAKARAELPETLKINVYDVRGKLVQQRLGILITNGWQGLILVLLALFIFLNARVAFWTAAGIPVALFATLAVMYASGQSINMVSMFALIMMLGIIVDDAIVVGEHASTLEEQGVSRLSRLSAVPTACLRRSRPPASRQRPPSCRCSSLVTASVTFCAASRWSCSRRCWQASSNASLFFPDTSGMARRVASRQTASAARSMVASTGCVKRFSVALCGLPSTGATRRLRCWLRPSSFRSA